MPDLWFVPSSNRLIDSFYSISLDEFRQCTQPMRMVMPANAFLATLLAGSTMVNHAWNGRPIHTAFPKTVFAGIGGLWLGYYVARCYYQSYFGKFKYNYEYALSRKEDFAMAVPPKFSDPSELQHWEPLTPGR